MLKERLNPAEFISLSNILSFDPLLILSNSLILTQKIKNKPKEYDIDKIYLQCSGFESVECLVKKVLSQKNPNFCEFLLSEKLREGDSLIDDKVELIAN